MLLLLQSLDCIFTCSKYTFQFPVFSAVSSSASFSQNMDSTKESISFWTSTFWALRLFSRSSFMPPTAPPNHSLLSLVIYPSPCPATSRARARATARARARATATAISSPSFHPCCQRHGDKDGG
jgi:hypothetical protein